MILPLPAPSTSHYYLSQAAAFLDMLQKYLREEDALSSDGAAQMPGWLNHTLNTAGY